jgi:hypothetical protein
MVSGYSKQTVEARKLGLLPEGKGFEAERERMKPLERNKRVCVDNPTQVIILMEDPGYFECVTAA